jgi:hypothetical protein
MTIQSIRIENTGGALTDQQVRIDGHDVFTGEEVEFFTDIGLTTPIDFFRIDSRTWWIKLSLSAGTTTIYAAWDEIGITGGDGVGANVFEWFEDFTDLSQWTETDAGGDIAVSGNVLQITGGAQAWNQALVGNTTFGRGHAVGFKGRCLSDIGDASLYQRYMMIGWHDSGAGASYTDLVYAFYPWMRNTQIYEDGIYRISLAHEERRKWIPANGANWDIEVIAHNPSGATYQAKTEGKAEFETFYESTYSSESNLKPAFALYNASWEFDFVYVRKEPAAPVKVYLVQDTVTVSNDGPVLTDFQVKVESPFFRDKSIEFFTTSGLTTPLDYWREDRGTYWVKVPSVTASGDTTIHVAWGSQLDEHGDGSNTFDWFEDWSDGTTGWTATSTAPTVNELDIMEIQVGALYPNSSVLSSPQGYMFEARMSPRSNEAGQWAGFMIADTTNIQSGNGGGAGHAMTIFNGATRDKIYYASDGAVGYNIVSGGTSHTAGDDDIYIYGMGLDTTNTYFQVNRGDISSQQYTGTWNSPVYPYFGYFTGSGAGATNGQDHRVWWALARKITPNTVTVVPPNPGKYRPVIISNTGAALTDQQVLIENFLLDRDIAFYADENAGVPLPYWKEEDGIYWVKVDLPANDSLTVYAFYGGISAGDDGDGDQVFEFFDDFEDASLDTSTKWTLTGTGFTEVEGKLHGGVNSLNYLTSQNTITAPAVVRTVIRETVPVPNGFTPIGFWTATSDQWTTLAHNSTSYYRNDGSWVNYAYDGSNMYEAPGGNVGFPNAKNEDIMTIHGSQSRAERRGLVSTDKYDSGLITNTVSIPKVYLGARGDHASYGQTYFCAWDFVMVYKPTESNTITTSIGAEASATAIAELGHGFFGQVVEPNHTIGYAFGIPQTPTKNTLVHFPKNQRHATIGIRDITFLKGKGDK